MKTEKPVWNSFARALEAELREFPKIRGASGIEHNFEALAIDEMTKRLILISSDPNPRVAALAQIDIEQSMPDYRVLVARPIAFDVPEIFKRILAESGTATINISQQLKAIEKFERKQKKSRDAVMDKLFRSKGIEIMLDAIKHSLVPLNKEIVTIVEQLSNLDWSNVLGTLKGEQSNATIDLSAFASIDTAQIDRKLGICPIPIYEFLQEDMEILKSDDIDSVTSLLLRKGIYQYFYPSTDELALGLVDGGVSTAPDLRTGFMKTNAAGHLIREPNFSGAKEVLALIDSLKERGMAVEVEGTLQIADAGAEFRATVKSKPMEGLIFKYFRQITNRFGFNFDLKGGSSGDGSR